MSWAAHDLEPYVIQKHAGVRLAFVPLLIGSYAPDLASKWFVYGITLFGAELKADDPAQFHRGWPGVGFTHSLLFGVAVALLLYALTRSKIWAISFLVGHWAHALTDVGDTVGTMLLFPFTSHLFSVGAWAYAGQTGRFTDAAAYFSGFGFVWDGIFLVWALLGWRVLTRRYFRQTIARADWFWGRLGRFLSEDAMLALYRAAFFYGACRWTAWLIWAHVVNDYEFDLTWGGPHWVPAVHADELNPEGVSAAVVAAGALVLGTLALAAFLRARIPSGREPSDELAPVGVERGAGPGPGILARMLGARGGGDDDVHPRV
jgi:hypothetical protein